MQPIYLVKVEPEANNNKFYKMIPNGDSFTVEYGRIGNGGFQTDSYPISRWDSQLKSKLKKGYVDQTHLVAELISVVRDNKYANISNPAIAKIVELLQNMAKRAIEENYTISSNKVTSKMISAAQDILDRMSKVSDIYNFNEYLVELFRVIPRKMKSVSENLAETKKDFSVIMLREQDLLDTMRGQVVQKTILASDDGVDNNKQTILEALGLEISEVSKKEEDEIKSHLGSVATKFHRAWKVVNKKTQKAFDTFVKENNITEKKMLWHGSRNENWWSIINTGLVLRPNAVITGKMFGNGIYFAPKASKSLGYTSLSGSYWARGTSNSAFMSVYSVAYGKPYDVYSFESKFGNLDYEKLQKLCKGANSLHAHEGSMLRNDEIVVYKEEQITIKYLVELKGN